MIATLLTLLLAIAPASAGIDPPAEHTAAAPAPDVPRTWDPASSNIVYIGVTGSAGLVASRSGSCDGTLVSLLECLGPPLGAYAGLEVSWVHPGPSPWSLRTQLDHGVTATGEQGTRALVSVLSRTARPAGARTFLEVGPTFGAERRVTNYGDVAWAPSAGATLLFTREAHLESGPARAGFLVHGDVFGHLQAGFSLSVGLPGRAGGA